ncbi:uncharacterized protein IL334_002168 [Kwoniella shivajii]|uniref:SH3 domain-containing protein n=1 Tax=Kwoniella shivajii TaxID=564305 RepID=A0ABZ1CVK1_9TREE|nr:hypothetical protein IL334_002168 [Kwoniella shivajii]
MAQLIDPDVNETLDEPIIPNPTSTRRVASADKDTDSMSLPIGITSASAVTSSVARISTSAIASATSANGQNPATPLTSTAKSTIIASSVLPSTSTIVSTSTTPSTSLKPSTTSTTSSAKPTTTSSSTIAKSSTTSNRSSSSTSISANASKASSSASSSATKAASENGKSGIAGTGLSLGAFVGIVIGGVVALVLIGIIATRTIRKKQRKDRAKRRSAMFEWPSTTGMNDGINEEYEKPRYEPPSQSYAMSDAYPNTNGRSGGGNGSVSYVTNETSYSQVPSLPPTNQSYMERNNPQFSYGNQSQNQPSYPPQQQYPKYHENIVPPSLAPVVPTHTGNASSGLRDGTMVRVQVGFVRSLEDELAISPGQQLYLHQIYDDGWCLCEDSNKFKGVVPISCIQPLSNNDHGLAPNMRREGSGGSAGSAERLQRRSSLYREA